MSKAVRSEKSRSVANTGFGAQSSTQGGRLSQKDGSANIRKTGLPFWQQLSVFHTALHMRTVPFVLAILGFYCTLNVLFATLYFFIGVDKLAGTEGAVTPTEKFFEAFFFSSQTLTTLGYGRVAPVGVLTNVVAFFEALIGIMAFAIVTGLMYARFARPKAFIVFSHYAVIAPYGSGQGLMFRLASRKNNLLTDLDAQVTIALRDTPAAGGAFQFYQVALEISHIGNLALNWTVVHAITEASPLWGFGAEDYGARSVEVIVAIRGFDDHFSTTVQQRTSYHGDEIVHSAKFKPMFKRSAEGEHTLLRLDAIDDYERVNLPQMAEAADASS